MKTSRVLLIILLLIIVFLLHSAGKQQVTKSELTDDPVGVTIPETKMFAGELTEFNSGCYADGECYATVAGKHITIAKGWSQEVVGSVIGTDDGMGGLIDHLGEDVEVYAQQVEKNNYTLYGNRDYYIKVN
jgi:hypothetical protein